MLRLLGVCKCIVGNRGRGSGLMQTQDHDVIGVFLVFCGFCHCSCDALYKIKTFWSPAGGFSTGEVYFSISLTCKQSHLRSKIAGAGSRTPLTGDQLIVDSDADYSFTTWTTAHSGRLFSVPILSLYFYLFSHSCIIVLFLMFSSFLDTFSETLSTRSKRGQKFTL